MNFWNNYQYLCTKNGLSVYDVARKCGVKSSASVSYWKQGSVPKPEVLSKVAQFFAVSINDLTGTDIAAAEILASSSNSDDPIYSAILKLNPQKRARALAYIAGLNAIPD